MFSACMARLMTNLSGNRLQLISSYQMNKEICLNIGIALNNNKELKKSVSTVQPILNRLVSEPSFMVNLIQHDSIITGVIKLTSSLEFYLNDLVSLCMVRNHSLLRKGLKDININPIDIVEMQDLDLIRRKYIKIIAQEKCKGELWSNKLKRVSSFLDLSNKYYSNNINKTIDSIWEMRNVIAHGNPNKLRFYDSNNKISLEHTETSSSEEYLRFIICLINAGDKLLNLLIKLDDEALIKWPAKDMVLK